MQFREVVVFVVDVQTHGRTLRSFVLSYGFGKFGFRRGSITRRIVVSRRYIVNHAMAVSGRVASRQGSWLYW